MRTDAHGRSSCGRGGIRYLEEDRVEGTDPLAPFGPAAAREVTGTPVWPTSATWSSTARWTRARTRSQPTRSWWATTGGSAAGRAEAVLVHPRQWPVDEAPLVGADAVHRQLVRWLRHAGQRTSIADPPSRDGQLPSPSVVPERQQSSAVREA